MGALSAQRTIAAIYVDPRGCYAGLPNIELWDEKRDARLYPGPYPVVAHPPCARWCRLAGLVEARWGHKRGEDGGCFAAALASVRKWGGVLEHPAYSDAWKAFGLHRPAFGGGWSSTLFRPDEWTCEVEQGEYGHPARKRTWLLAVRTDLPSLRWRAVSDSVAGPTSWRDSRKREKARALVSWCGNRVADGEVRPRVGKRAASATPTEFRDLLIAMARSVRP